MTRATERIEASELRRVYSCFPSGVAAICALDEHRVPTGMAVSSFTSVSLDPPLVSVSIQNTSTTWPVLARAARLGVSVLAGDQHTHARSLATKNGDRFVGLAWSATDRGAVVIDAAVAWLDCSLEAAYPAGDHRLVLLRVLACGGDAGRSPLVFHGSRFRSLTVD
ncbi:MAG TPA: flavin reductase family protein [Pseudonocardiaceae bacterium]|jgi:flavin reductase (DIM6/NTAB) family NADH-FMN oxidoreductase RutF